MTLPPSIAALFWDFDERVVDWDRHRDLVIGRVLSQGSLEDMQWVRRQAGDEELRAWIRRARGRVLSRSQLRFWQLLLDLPEEEVVDMLADPARQIWDRRVPG